MATQITNIVSNSDYEGYINYLVFAPTPATTDSTVYGTLTVTNADGLGNTVIYNLTGDRYISTYNAYYVQTTEIQGSPSAPQTRNGKLTAKLTEDVDSFIMNYKHFSNGYFLDGESEPAHNIPQGLGVTYTDCTELGGSITANFFSEPPAPQHTNESQTGQMLLTNLTTSTAYGNPTNVYRNNIGFPDLSSPTYAGIWQNVILPQGSYTFRIFEDPAVGTSSVDISLEFSCCDNVDTTAPNLNNTIVNTSCPTNSYNVSNFTASNISAGKTLEIHTVPNPTSNATIVTGSVAPGSYYAVFFISTCGGYSLSTPITINNSECNAEAVNDNVTVTEQVSTPINVANNDTNCEFGTTTRQIFTAPTNGVLVKNSETTFTYLSNAGATSDSFVYTLYCNGVAVNNATVNITVLSASGVTATANDDNVITNINTPISGDVTPNDTACSVGVTTYTIGTNPTNGTLILNTNGTFTYTPNNNFIGTDTATIELRCDNVVIDTSVLTFNVVCTAVGGGNIDGVESISLNIPYTYTVTGLTGNGDFTYNWIITGGVINSGQNTNSINVTFTSEINSLSVNVSNCNNTSTINVTKPLTTITNCTPTFNMNIGCDLVITNITGKKAGETTGNRVISWTTSTLQFNTDAGVFDYVFEFTLSTGAIKTITLKNVTC